MSDAALNHLSRSLVFILRHQARNKGIMVSDDGFARVGDVLRLRRLHGASRESIEQVVETSRHRDGIPRFELRQNHHGEWLIRAMRHHSMAGVDPGAEPSDLDAFGAVLVGSSLAGDRRQSEPDLGFHGPRPSGASQVASEHSGDDRPIRPCAICRTELLDDPPPRKCRACGKGTCHNCIGRCYQPGCQQRFCSPCLHDPSLACSSH